MIKIEQEVKAYPEVPFILKSRGSEHHYLVFKDSRTGISVYGTIRLENGYVQNKTFSSIKDLIESFSGGGGAEIYEDATLSLK